MLFAAGIVCPSPDVCLCCSVIVDTREWRHFKELSKTLTPLEEDMFHLEGNTLRPQVYLRPKETVYIPFKYQTFNADHAVMTQVRMNSFPMQDINPYMHAYTAWLVYEDMVELQCTSMWGC